MTAQPEQTTAHATFTIERSYNATPARVFRAFADPHAKRRWFVDEDGWRTDAHELDFRPGGFERAKGAAPNGMTYANETLYHDIVADRRIVFAYAMDIDGKRISVSLATIALDPTDDGTRLTYTEQTAFFEGGDGPAMREGGCRALFDKLDTELTRAA